MIKSLLVFLLGIFATFYLINPGAGFIELLPDNLPFIGNLDEATATALLLACLRYFGIDPISLFTREKRKPEVSVDVESERMP
ncbi:MAG TPA: hypothetical protein VF593_04920 [Chthoniobacteraceae bacterium]|jgi:hypothetical protein